MVRNERLALGLVIKTGMVFCGFPAAKCILCSVTSACVQGPASQTQTTAGFLLMVDDFQQLLQQMAPWKVSGSALALSSDNHMLPL